jgi:hypothetical protein
MSALGSGCGPGVPDVDVQRDSDDDVQAGSNPGQEDSDSDGQARPLVNNRRRNSQQERTGKRLRRQLNDSSCDSGELEDDVLPVPNEYEMFRMANIARNFKIFRSLGITQASTAAGRQPKAATRTKNAQKAGHNVSNMAASTGTRRNPRRNQNIPPPNYRDAERNIGDSDTEGQRRSPATGPDTPRRPRRSSAAPTGINKMVSSDSDSDADHSDVLAEGSHGHHDEGGHPPTRAEKANEDSDPAELEKQSGESPPPVGGAAGDASAGSVDVPTERPVKRPLFKLPAVRLPLASEGNQLLNRAYHPRYVNGVLVKGRGNGTAMNAQWETLMPKTPTSSDPTGLLAKCPVLRNSGPAMVKLTMLYLHDGFWDGSSGGMHVANGGQRLPDDVDNPFGTLPWMHLYTDCSRNIQFFRGLKIAGFPGIVRASPNTDHKDSTVGRNIPGPIVAWERTKDAKLSEPIQYAQVECFFSFHSRDLYQNFVSHDMALVRKMHRLECGSWGTLLASCADTKLNPKGSKMLQVINVHRILAEVVLVRNEEPATIGCSSWWSRIMMPDGITADSSHGKGDGSLLWHLPVLAV